MALPIGSGGSETNRRGAELLCRLHQQCEMDNIRLQARAAEGKFEVEHNLAVVVRELSDLVPDGIFFCIRPSSWTVRQEEYWLPVRCIDVVTGRSIDIPCRFLDSTMERFENLVLPSLKSM